MWYPSIKFNNLIICLYMDTILKNKGTSTPLLFRIIKWTFIFIQLLFLLTKPSCDLESTLAQISHLHVITSCHHYTHTTEFTLVPPQRCPSYAHKTWHESPEHGLGVVCLTRNGIHIRQAYYSCSSTMSFILPGHFSVNISKNYISFSFSY